ncbi:MAG: C1 family peptidase [Phaeodactylibacter sp.]|nr:C1 family peptidase [Phaeodactylibacter sp.]MCB9049491.1 C1 family peptidase [Lewinellaceae bacterium]
MRFFLLLTLLLFFTFRVMGQGVILDDEAYEKTPLVEKAPDRGRIPTAVDLRPYCPRPGDQGGLPSCAAWSLANAMTIQQALAKEQTDTRKIEKMRFSVAYIYNQVGDCYRGATFPDCLELLQQKGDCPAALLPYSQDCAPIPENHHHARARANRIKGYRKVFSLSAGMDEKIKNILDEVGSYRPVVVACKIPYNFRNNIPEVRGSWPAEELHAMVVAGYNEYAETFTLMNSYGPDWGDQGFFEMDWETLGKAARYGYVLEVE